MSGIKGTQLYTEGLNPTLRDRSGDTEVIEMLKEDRNI